MLVNIWCWYLGGGGGKKSVPPPPLVPPPMSIISLVCIWVDFQWQSSLHYNVCILVKCWKLLALKILVWLSFSHIFFTYWCQFSHINMQKCIYLEALLMVHHMGGHKCDYDYLIPVHNKPSEWKPAPQVQTVALKSAHSVATASKWHTPSGEAVVIHVPTVKSITDNEINLVHVASNWHWSFQNFIFHYFSVPVKFLKLYILENDKIYGNLYISKATCNYFNTVAWPVQIAQLPLL